MRTKPYATAIALFDEVELLDVTGPLSVLSGAGRQWNFQPFKVELVGSRVGTFSTRSELELRASSDFDGYEGAECLLVPGGYGARVAAEQPALLRWVQRMAARAEIVAAIGNGAWILAKAGLLDEQEVAASPELSREIHELCTSARPNARDAVCVSGKLVTARASALGLDLSCEIAAHCFGKKLASTLSSSLGIDWSGELGAIEIVPGPLLVK